MIIKKSINSIQELTKLKKSINSIQELTKLSNLLNWLEFALLSNFGAVNTTFPFRYLRSHTNTSQHSKEVFSYLAMFHFSRNFACTVLFEPCQSPKTKSVERKKGAKFRCSVPWLSRWSRVNWNIDQSKDGESMFWNRVKAFYIDYSGSIIRRGSATHHPWKRSVSVAHLKSSHRQNFF